MRERTEVGGKHRGNGGVLDFVDVGSQHFLRELLALLRVAHQNTRVRLRIEASRCALSTQSMVMRLSVAYYEPQSSLVTCVRRRISASVFSGTGVDANALMALRARMTCPKDMVTTSEYSDCRVD